ncbi:MAG: Uma2 family endonuclease [Pseudomonadota bacterium]|nr:Uma2 family endonuclease [Pseudomonadota bacterium]
MNPPGDTVTEPIREPEILADIDHLPTEDDLPCDDGAPMETWLHRLQMNVLIDALELQWAGRRDFFVGGNMFLHFDPANRRQCRGPDVFLVLGVERRPRKSWVVWQEGMRFPDLIIELLSDSTRETDFGAKKDLYERLFRTPEYYLYDPLSQEFHGCHLQSGRYQDIAPDGEGRIWSPVTGLHLAVRGEWLRWLGRDGQILPTAREWADQLARNALREKRRADQAEQRADQAEQRAGQERQRAERLAARLRALGIDPDAEDR